MICVARTKSVPFYAACRYPQCCRLQKTENRICDSFALTMENSADFARASVRELSSVLSYTIAIRITQSGQKMRCYPRFGCNRLIDSILPEQGVYNGTYFVLSASRTTQPFTEVNWVVCTLLHELNLYRSAHLIRKYISYSVQKKNHFCGSSFL